MTDGWKPLATIARLVDVPEASARRYVQAFPTFFPARKVGKATVYPPEAGDILRLASDLFGQGARRAEVEAALSERFAPTVDVVASRHDPATESPTALVDVVGRLAAAMERQAAALERIAERLPLEAARTPQDQRKPRPATREPSEAPTARTSRPDATSRVVGLHREGLGSRAIARKLNEAGTPTISGRGRWAKGIVGQLLKEAKA